MTITGQLPAPSIAAQVLDLAPASDAPPPPGGPRVPGFTGQGWHSHETMLAVRWLLAHPDAWQQAMRLAEEYPGNPHTVADSLHERIVPRAVLDQMAADGLDPARVDWLEIAHELAERRTDPHPAGDGGSEHGGIAAQALDLAAWEHEARGKGGRWTGGTLYHGTHAELKPGDIVHTSYGWAHVTTKPFVAASYARLRGGGHIYHVEPLGEVERDEHVSGIGATSSYRSRAGFRVIREHDQTPDEVYFGTLTGPPKPKPAPAEAANISAQALDLAAAAPVPDDPDAIALYTAHRVDDTGRHLAHASERLDAARDASGGLRDYHMEHCAGHLDGAHRAAHQLAAHLRGRYPAEGDALDSLVAAVGLARSVSEQAKTATTAHLVQTVCNHLGHTMEHVKAMAADGTPEVWGFNAEHARTHLNGAAEHVAKLREHLAGNYPAEAGYLKGLEAAGVQLASPGTISGQLDLASWDPLKHPRDAHGRFARKGTMTQGKVPWEYDTHFPRADQLRAGD